MLAGKVAIVTGAAGGQGAEAARVFVEEGAKVVLTDFNAELGRQTAAELGKDALFVKHDVTSEADWATALNAAADKFGTVDVLVNNAGILVLEPLDESSVSTLDRILAVNVRGAYLGLLAVTPVMKANGGSIINISSLAGYQGQANATAYSASKWAVRGMTKSAALELGRYGIRVNSIHPGMIATPMTVPQGAEAPFGDFPLAALNRVGTPADTAQLVAFLASDRSSYITGAEVLIDGGMGAGISAQLSDILNSLG